MSRFAFNPSTGPIHVATEVTGPAGSLVLKFILDTGATTSLIDISTLISLGFAPHQSGKSATVLTEPWGTRNHGGHCTEPWTEPWGTLLGRNHGGHCSFPPGIAQPAQ